jgi:hypothetical protein
MTKKMKLSNLHIEILQWMAKRAMRKITTLVTPDRLARAWHDKITHDEQQWAYLQLARLQAKGFLKRPERGHYQITTKGLRRARVKPTVKAKRAA